MKALKIPDSNKAGIKLIKVFIKGVSQTKLFGIRGLIDNDKTLTEDERSELMEALKQEYKKRKIEWID